MSSPNTTSAEMKTTTPTTPAPTHSQGLSAFLTQLSGAYQSNDPTVIISAQHSLINALKSEKKIEAQRVEVNKDNEFAERFSKTLSVDENEKEIKLEGDGKTKLAKEGGCCGCGGCDDFKEKNEKSF